MIEQKLTTQEIQSIFDFTTKKYIKYYDVQLELVDHIANRIETMRAENQNLSFENALQQVYKSFGVFGFTKVQEQKSLELQRYWRKRVWTFIKSYFKLPRILITATLSILIYGCLSQGLFINVNHLVDNYIYTLIKVAISIIVAVPILLFAKRQIIITSKKLLCIDAYLSTIGWITWFALYMGFDLFFVPITTSIIVMIIASILLSVLIILFYGLLFIFPAQLKEQVIKDYNYLIISDL